MEHVRHKERGQLPVAKTTPVAMRKPDGIDSFLDSHSIKPVQEKRDVINSFDSLLLCALYACSCPPGSLLQLKQLRQPHLCLNMQAAGIAQKDREIKGNRETETMKFVHSENSGIPASDRPFAIQDLNANTKIPQINAKGPLGWFRGGWPSNPAAWSKTPLTEAELAKAGG